ncbi:MAG TPA: hypothetical protein DD412_00215 [Holosporales bacterium]|nr:hypothetical protein [Holosporales bacterium]
MKPSTPFDSLLYDWEYIKAKSTAKYSCFGRGKAPRSIGGGYTYNDKLVVFYHQSGKWVAMDCRSNEVFDYAQYCRNFLGQNTFVPPKEATYAPPKFEDDSSKIERAKANFARWKHVPPDNYLINERGLSMSSVEGFRETHGRVLKANSHGVVFALKNTKHDFVGMFKRTSAAYFKGEAKRITGQKGVFSAGIDTANRIFVCEGAIDCLSIYELLRRGKMEANTGYIATCGEISQSQKAFLSTTLKSTNATTYICGDNDLGGNKFNSIMKKLLKDKKVLFKQPKEGFKDFNEQLLKYC